MAQSNPYYLANWKRLLRLGAELLNLDSLEAQKAMILDATRELLACEANLFLSENGAHIPNFQEVDQDASLLMLTALEQRQIMAKPLHTENRLKKTSGRLRSPEGHSTGAAIIAAPLFFHDVSLGVLQLSRPKGPAFSKDELELVEGLAMQSAIAIQASQQIEKNRKQIRLLSLVRKVSQQIAELLDLDELTRQVARLIQETFNYYYVAIFTIEPGSDVLRFWHSARQLSSNTSSEPVSPLAVEGNQEFLVEVKIGQGIIGRVALTGEAIIANDVSQNPYYRVLDTLPETKSEAALPLRIENRVLGVLDVQSHLPEAFDETDILVLGALADNIATAVENARLYSDVNRRASHLSVVAEVSNAITSILDLDDLLQEVVRLVSVRLGYPVVHVYSVHSGRRKIFFQAGITHGNRIEPSDEFTIDLDDPLHRIAYVAREGKSQIVNIAGSGHTDQDESLYSQLIVPLTFADEILGILEVKGDPGKLFGQDDQFLLNSLADHIAIALRNASLFRSEMWRRRVADSMREVAGLLTADAALEQVLDLILKELIRALPCDIAAIWLSEDEDVRKSPSNLKLSAIQLTQEFESYLSKMENALTPPEIVQLLNQTEVPSPWLIDALSSPYPKIRQKKEPYEPLGAIFDFPSDYSAIAAPLKVGGEPLGVLVLIHRTSDRYGHEAQAMTDTFASYAAVAIENTRLYEAAHDQAWVSTVLLQVAEATQSLNTLDELLSTMARITPMLVGVNSCSFFLWDSASDTFSLAASYGLAEKLDSNAETLRIPLGEFPVFDQLFFAKGPVVVSGAEISSLLPDSDLASKSFVLFPMISRNEVLGALLIDYNAVSDPSQAKKYAEGVGWDEKFAIIQGIAHQTAVAAENIRLLKAQQDEAYVSMALLQVAQAVVSSNTLDETLAAIVRITPILVGVKRSLIYLWDSDRNIFYLSQSYGLNRSELQEMSGPFQKDEFPILEAVRNNNAIVYHAISPETEVPLSWKNVDRFHFDFIEQDIQELLGLEKSQSEAELSIEYLRSPHSLLHGFPLSVKGEVLGVLLTQEMDLVAGRPSRQVREKRLEITIGITQQAAMAIQSDQLQREVVERERLEREFQLAREIQETFLPDHLPTHPGWDLVSLWRPARQVSGDFYDVIELSNQHWGLVIADVADKGMPAALYMTLIRSLIRAAIKDEISPASVLRRVNDLLVADSKSGMFVTIFYAVLSLESGALDYANAGHNPPVLLRRNLELMKLTGTAMALGIFEGIDVKQEQIAIHQGDSLVLYTDGITEAFSPQDELFGEERLIQVIQQNKNGSVADLANAIDQAVFDFTGGDTSSDDITLVILRRKS